MLEEIYPASDDIFVLVVDVIFALAAGWWVYCIRPLPKTYLSEIIFPFQFCVRGLASLWLMLLTSLSFLADCFYADPTHLVRPLMAAEGLVWLFSTMLIWMEHRRSLQTFPLLRFFWIFRWSIFVKTFVGILHEPRLWTIKAVSLDVFLVSVLGCMTILAVAAVWPQKEITTSSPEVLALTRDRLRSFTGKSFIAKAPPSGTYGSIGLSKLKQLFSEPSTIKHASFDGTIPLSKLSLKIYIPSWTISRRADASFVSYKILIVSPDETWSVRRRFSDFVHLREGLPDYLRKSQYFPDKSLFKRFDPKLIDSRRTRLEKYLNFLVSHPHFDAQTSLPLCDFLELVRQPAKYTLLIQD
ncbi:Aste57867_1404 [Aphanomyces stellatus]|uniref:Aste57867_1404 protein n=1 Tax=Aphanomyces stellatus TaxID=120398 RepID=A0A485K578_9STRA|nr:hypothetical protein As57867_001403 [Aphanomyces stellatus]VFT78621.1 Aste57867_1404 [Aphanomyces stellatus]